MHSGMNNDPRRKDDASASRRGWQRHPTNFIPTVAVLAVAMMAVLAAVMVTGSPPPGSGQVLAGLQDGSPACGNCGVVESVVAVQGDAQGQRRTVGYLMQVRMDDGTLRIVEHSVGMAAGSRVIVESGGVRLKSGQG